MPASYRLEPIGEKRFGARWARLSRLVAIDDPPKKSAALVTPGASPLAALQP
jgi:hypothetical protein